MYVPICTGANSQWDKLCSIGRNIIRVDHEREDHDEIEDEGQQQ